jgi:hypothetical protein
VPVEDLSDLKITSKSFEVGLNALPGAGQSRGKGETIYEWWPAITAPDSIKFLLTFKNGTQISQQTTISASVYNRFGISEVYLVNRGGNCTIELRYGIVSEYDRTHRGSVNTWCFANDGTLERFSHDEYLRKGQIGLYYTNVAERITLVQATRYIDDTVPRITLRYGNGGELNEVEVYHWDEPEGIEMFYSTDSTVRKVTRDKKIYHPGGVLLKDIVKEDITNQPKLYSGYRFPDLSFLGSITFDPKRELETRNIKLKRE